MAWCWPAVGRGGGCGGVEVRTRSNAQCRCGRAFFGCCRESRLGRCLTWSCFQCMIYVSASVSFLQIGQWGNAALGAPHNRPTAVLSARAGPAKMPACASRAPTSAREARCWTSLRGCRLTSCSRPLQLVGFWGVSMAQGQRHRTGRHCWRRWLVGGLAQGGWSAAACCVRGICGRRPQAHTGLRAQPALRRALGPARGSRAKRMGAHGGRRARARA